MTSENRIFGLMAGFDNHERLLEATKEAYKQGYRRMDAYTPFPVEGLPEALGSTGTSVALIVLLCGIIGGLSGYFMEWYAMVVSYPINIGGRPFNSWPAYVPITFELTVLAGAFGALIGMLALNRLPRPHHPVFNTREFERATTDRFFLCIEATDPKFDLTATRQFLEGLEPESLKEVEA